MIWGLITMMLIIVMTDQLLWRPLIAWADKFKFEKVESSSRVSSPILHPCGIRMRWRCCSRYTLAPLSELIYARLARRQREQIAQPKSHAAGNRSKLATVLLIVGADRLRGCAFAAFHALVLLRHGAWGEYLDAAEGRGATFLRVNVALLMASAWTIPVGVAIGFHPRLAKIAQPLAQIAASFPATALFPLILVRLVRLGLGLGIGSIALMMLGTQWYILFNVIAGAMAIPSDLKEVADLFHFSRLQRWTTVILPGIFPYLITGLVTASAVRGMRQIVAEYFHLKDQTLTTRAGRADQRGQRSGQLSDSAAGDDHHGADGGDGESAGLAADVPAGGKQVPPGHVGADNLSHRIASSN